MPQNRLYNYICWRFSWCGWWPVDRYIHFSFLIVICLWGLAIFADPLSAQSIADTDATKKATSSFGALPASTSGEAASGWFDLDKKARQALDEGRVGEADQLFREAIKIAESKGEYDPGVVNSMIGLSLLNHKQGNTKESERLYEFAMRHMEGLGSRDSLAYTKWLPDLAWLYQEHGRPDQAEILHKQFLSVMEKAHGDRSRELLPGIDQYADFLRKNSRHSEASVLDSRLDQIKQNTEKRQAR